jgi:RNA polymerase sigma factor (sigma-70 family)
MYQGRVVALMSDVSSLAGIRDKGASMGRESSPTSAPSGVWAQAADDFRRWRAGDGGGLDDLVGCLSPVLWHVVRAHGLDSERAQDVVQTTWLTFVRRHESITEPQAVAAWLTTTARREAWRVAKAASRHAPVADEVLEMALPSQPSAEAKAVTDDENTRLWACVHQLSERCQRLMRIVAFDDRPDYRGLAEDLQMPVGSIGPTRGRCLSKLKALLTEAAGPIQRHQEVPRD